MSTTLAESRIWVMGLASLIASVVACGGDDAHATDTQSAGGNNAGAKATAGTAGMPLGAGRGEAGASASGTGASGASGAGTGMSSAAGAPDDGAPTWTGIYNNAFKTCRVDVCHGGGLIGVTLATQQGAYDSLVDQPSNETAPCAKLGKKRVVPGDPDNSLLWLKLDINAPCGQQMPPGGSLPMKQIQRVRDWIMLGAKYD